MRNWKLFRAPKFNAPIKLADFEENEYYNAGLGDPWGLNQGKPVFDLPAHPEDILPFRKSTVAWLVSSLQLPLFVKAHYEEKSFDLVDYLPKTEEEMERILTAMFSIYDA